MFGPCGDEARCFTMFGGDVWHDPTWHRLQEATRALESIREAHSEPDRPGASCAEGCGGRWPCATWAEADHALRT